MSDASAVRMEDLLAHRQWVRGLARRLASDESGADDLEQETWLAAVERPPRDARSLRGWLGAVTRNIHRNARRDDFRRDRREQAVARPEPTDSVSDLVAEAEEQTLLVREVLALDEPYRSTVLLRWFEDLTPHQIAERQGAPLETVRTRLKRGVERLRERMDARHDGDRRAWCLLLLGRGDGVGTGAAAAGTKAALAGAAGGMAMGMATKFAVAAALLVAVGAGVWWTRSDVAPPAAPAQKDAASAAPAPSTKHERHVAAEERTTPAPTTVDLAKVDRDLDLHGTIVRADGTPVVGATVQAVDYPWRRTIVMDVDHLLESRLGPSTTTGAAGAFSLGLRRGETANLRVTADGLATLETGPYQVGGRVEIEMTSAVTLHVSLKDESGAAVASASLWALGLGTQGRAGEPWFSLHATTDASGTCDFVGLPGGGTAIVSSMAGAGQATKYATLPASGDTTVELVSPTGRVVRGRVFDATTRAPIQDAKVGLGRASLCATMTDGGGRFQIPGFTGKGERDVSVKAPGYAPAAIAVGETGDLEIALRRGLAVIGRVVDADGRPLPGARVAVVGTRGENGVEQASIGCVVADADGRFRAADLDPMTPHALTAFAPERGRVRRPIPFRRNGVEPFDVGDVVLGAPRAIEGVVLTPGGKPAPGVDVWLAGPDAGAFFEATSAGARESRRTDDLGRFRFVDLAPGAYWLEAHLQQTQAVATEVTLTADCDVLGVVLPPKPKPSGIKVLVVDDDGKPLPRVIVVGHGPFSGDVLVTTDAEGRGEFPTPPRGAIATVWTGWPFGGEPFLRGDEVKITSVPVEVRIVAHRGAFLDVKLLGPDGNPVKGAWIEVEPKESRGGASRHTDANGHVEARVPRDGEFSIVFRGDVFDGKQSVDSLLDARADHVTAQSGEVVLRCSRVATDRSAMVRVLKADGSAAAGVVVYLSVPSGVTRHAKTDADGRVRFNDLPARELTAWPGEYRYGTLVTPPAKFVPAGQEVTLAPPPGVAVSGQVTWSTGEPVARGATVVVLRGGSDVCTASTDRDGRFTVQVPVGDDGPFTLHVTAMDDKRPVVVDVRFAPKDGEIRVVVPR